MSDNCIFCKIIKKEIPAKVIYEDENVLAFEDINPVAPIHVLVIPKKHIETLVDVNENNSKDIAYCYEAISKISRKMGIDEDGFRIIANCKNYGGQEVYHIHFHMIGGKKLPLKIVE